MDKSGNFPSGESRHMRTIGVDPGSVITGYGIVENQKQNLVHVTSGYIRVGGKSSFPDRLKSIYEELSKVICRFNPDIMAVEGLFFAKNVKSALLLGQARGVAILSGVNAGLEICEYSPLEIKQSVVGYGRASKRQVQEMVRLLLSLPDIPESNTADGLAVAICHTNTSQSIFNTRLRSSCK